MNKSNNIKNIYIKSKKTYNKNLNKNLFNKYEANNDNTSEKSDIAFIKNSNLIKSNTSQQNNKTTKSYINKDNYKNNNIKIYYNNEDKKKKSPNMNMLIDNIEEKEEEVTTNAVNIHNINLINSMNNITFYDSHEDNKIPSLKKDYMKNPINKYNSKIFYKTKDKKANSSMDIGFNNNNKKNIIVNKKRILLDNKNSNTETNKINSIYKNNSLSMKKNPFKEISFKKLHLTLNNFNKGVSKFIKESNNYKKEYNANTFKNETTKGELLQVNNINNRNNNNINKTMFNNNNNNSNKSDFSVFNTYTNYTSSMGEEDTNNFNNKMILDKINNKNIINVNKSEIFKTYYNIKSGYINRENNIFFNNDNNINNELSSRKKKDANSSSNIFSLLSNNNKDNYKKPILDKQNLNTIKKNINNRLYKAKSKDNRHIIIKKEKNNCVNLKKTKSEERRSSCKSLKHTKKIKSSANNENKDITKKMNNLYSFLNGNYKDNKKLNFEKNLCDTENLNETYSRGNIFNNNTSTFTNNNKYNYLSINSDYSSKDLINNAKLRNLVYPNKICYNKEMPTLIKKSLARKTEKQKDSDLNCFGKIEVNKKIFTHNNNKSQINKNNQNQEQMIDTKNEAQSLCSKKSQKELWINDSEQYLSNSKNIDDYCYLSNYKVKKEVLIKDIIKEKSAPKKHVSSNLVYNKKQLSYINNGRQSLENKLLSPDFRSRKMNLKELEAKSNNKNKTCEDLIIDSNTENRNDINLEEELPSNYIDKEQDDELIYDVNSKNISNNSNINSILNNAYLLKSPSTSKTIYKKPDINNLSNSNSFIINNKDSFNNKFLHSNEVKEEKSPMKKKRNLNMKLNRFVQSKELSNNNCKVLNIDIEKTKENNFIQSIKCYNSSKNNNVPKITYKEINNSKDFVKNIGQYSVAKVNKKVILDYCNIKKYCCYFICNNKKKINCYVSKIRLNKRNLIINQIPVKKVCYFSKKRKVFVKILPIIEICYFKKGFITNNNNKNNCDILEDHPLINNEIGFINKTENDENNNKFFNNQYSFASMNFSEPNINEASHNYYDISLGKTNPKSKNNNNRNMSRFFSPERNSEEKIINEINKASNNENKLLNDNINISPFKVYLNNNNKNNNIEKTEKGLKLLEKIVNQKVSTPFDKKKNIHPKVDSSKKEDNKETKKNYNDDKTISNNDIKKDFIELLNIITINNYDIILNKISDLILSNNMINIDNISNLINNQNIFIDIIMNKAMTEKKFIKIYSQLCKDLFISLMSIIDNYNDDFDIFNKITKDKSLKVFIKNKIMEKLDEMDSISESILKNKDKNNFDKDSFYYDLKIKFTGLINFIGELLDIKIISQKIGFEILDILFKNYTKKNNNIFNDLNLEGIEILISKMKIIIYKKNNPEHIQRYNKYIKNLNNIFNNRIEKDNLSKYLYYKIYNIIENYKNEEDIKKGKVKTFINYKYKINIPKLNVVSEKNKLLNNNNNSFDIPEKQFNINLEKNNPKYSQKMEMMENDMQEIIKKDIEKLLLNSNDEKLKNDFFEEINKKYNEEMNIKKSIEIWEMLYYYIEACIDLIDSEEKIYIGNAYLKNIINNFSIELPNEKWEMLHYKLISLFLNINEICSDNIYMNQIMGYLLYLLIFNKLFFIKDLNNFLNKDNQIIINIAKVVKYTIIFADKDAKKYHNDFKQTKLFIGNESFYNLVTVPLNKKYI